MDEKERARALDQTLGQIEKQFGKGSIMRLGSKDAILPISVIPTGSISFDAALGVGGFPRGRVIEVFGPEASGKTTITLQVIAEAPLLGVVPAGHDVQQQAAPGDALIGGGHVRRERRGQQPGAQRDEEPEPAGDLR